MRYLTLNEVLDLFHHILEQSGGSAGIRDFGALESALAQPRMTFDEKELYPTVVDKAAVLGFSLINNHPFVDGNKRIGHAAMEVFLIRNGWVYILLNSRVNRMGDFANQASVNQSLQAIS